ncbi:porin [Cupriavidus taiwanensis]|uniref:Putative OUTER MEMBRANE PORIN SIGNAL PEPTIDE PROTEIN n=1 Tax=Cupriavidus taiwanensis TaxID=164546 RepID=A0A375IZJ2_9BURK|nr:porin [Cupriavidus taiwanensis]SPR98328.1 putative OUTER MEMBRANE PORIN SIGNAL PEPTIDE PROTEIN [Cupriavidus taiwanensis]
MKKSLLALAALGAFAGAAQAQSSVTLYGVVDANIEYVSNMSSVTPSLANGLATGPAENVFRLTSGGLSGSRWGLRGVEDLGSGMKALFVLESGFGLDDGRSQQGGRLFGRQAYVGLESAQVGRVTFGRQYTTMFDMMANFSPTGYATQYEPVVAQLGLNFRSDNTAKYTGKFGPVTAIAHWSFGNGVAGAGEVPGQFRRDTGYGAGLAWAAGPFGISAAYDQYNPTLNAAGGTGDFKKAAVAASYAFGPAKLMAGYRWGMNKAANDNNILKDNYYWIGANYQVTPALGLTLAYYYDDVKNLNLAANGVTNNIKNPWQISFVADYNLSKRTDVYLTTAYAKNAGVNFDTSAISFANGYFLGTGKDNMVGVALGIRHKF